MIHRDYFAIDLFENHVEELLEGVILSLEDKIKIHDLCDRRLSIKSDPELDEYDKDYFINEIEEETDAMINVILNKNQ